MSRITLNIDHWEAWAPGRATPRAWAAWSRGESETDDRAPDIQYVDPLLRRRLGPGARMALDVARRCLGERQGIPTIFASRHGELARTLGMLRSLAAGEDLSPTAFSLSVHNTAAGVFSIARDDPAPATAIAAGEETFGYALLEAVARLSAGIEQVLLVYADEPAPAEYGRYIDLPEVPHALAVLLGCQGSNGIELETVASDGSRPGEMMSLAFLRLLAGDARQASWTGKRLSWHWTRQHG